MSDNGKGLVPILLTREQAERLKRYAIDEAMNATYSHPCRGRNEDIELWTAIADQLREVSGE